MKFETGKRYRHKNCLDVDIVIRKILWQDDNGVSCIVKWINQRSDFVHHELDRVFINVKSNKYWSEISSNKH